MPWSVRNASKVLRKCEVWLGDKNAITHRNVGLNCKMRFMHREGTGHCGTECLQYTTQRRGGWEGRKDGWADYIREVTVYIEVL